MKRPLTSAPAPTLGRITLAVLGAVMMITLVALLGAFRFAGYLCDWLHVSYHHAYWLSVGAIGILGACISLGSLIYDHVDRRR